MVTAYLKLGNIVFTEFRLKRNIKLYNFFDKSSFNR